MNYIYQSAVVASLNSFLTIQVVPNAEHFEHINETFQIFDSANRYVFRE